VLVLVLVLEKDEDSIMALSKILKAANNLSRWRCFVG
jgi:hypothetical protein